MAFTNDGLSVADIAAVTGENRGGAFGGYDGSYWIIILFLFAFMNNGWGGYGNGGQTEDINNDVQRGFDQSAIMNSLTGISSAVANGFANAEISRANTNTNTLQSIWGVQSALQNCC